MYQVVDYIFTNMALSNASIVKMQKMLRQQKTTNALFIFFNMFVVGHLVKGDFERMRQDKKIKKLEREIAELRLSEGE